jgi:hypothetical protein
MKIQANTYFHRAKSSQTAESRKPASRSEDSVALGSSPSPRRIAGIVGGALALGAASGLLVGKTPHAAALMAVATALGGIAGLASFYTDVT